jgi:hypothetical protein
MQIFWDVLHYYYHRLLCHSLIRSERYWALIENGQPKMVNENCQAYLLLPIQHSPVQECDATGDAIANNSRAQKNIKTLFIKAS